MSFKQKSISAIKWSFLDKFFKRGTKFLVAIVLARLLDPSDFGLLAMALVFLAIGNIFADLGLGQAIVQADKVTNKQSSTIFYINIATGFFFVIVFWSFSQMIANFYSDDRLVNIIRVISFSYLLNSFNLVQNMQFYRNLDIKSMTTLSVISDISSGILGIGLAYFEFGVWSLIYQRLARSITYTILIWMKSTWRPMFYFNFKEIKEMFSFGMSMFSIGLLTEFFNYIDTLLIGKYFSASFLGLFDRGKSFPTFLKNTFILPVTRPLFPILSKIKHDKEMLQKSIFTVFHNLDPILFLGFGLLAVFSEEIIVIVLKEKWLPAAIYLRIFAYAMSIASIFTVSTSLLKALGKKRVLMGLTVADKAMQMIFLLLGIFININYYLYGMIGISAVNVLVRIYFSKKFIGGEWTIYGLRYLAFAAITLALIYVKTNFLKSGYLGSYLVGLAFVVIYILFFYSFIMAKLSFVVKYIETRGK